MEQDPNFFNLLESLKFVSENYARIAIEEGLSLHDISCHDLLHLLQSSWSSSSTPVFSVGLHRLILELRAQNKIHSHGDRGDLDIYLNKVGACSPFPPCFLLVRRANTELEVLVPLNVEDSIDLDSLFCLARDLGSLSTETRPAGVVLCIQSQESTIYQKLTTRV